MELFKRTSHYSRQDFHQIEERCRRFERSRSLWTTPHVLTEVSNLLGHLDEPAEKACRRGMASFVSVVDEHFLEATKLASYPEFVRFGITDAAIVQLAASDVAIFTDDFALGGLLEERGVTVRNLRKIRSVEPSGAEL